MHPCVKCASLQKTCCQRAEILVTPGDARRIARHTRLADFAEWRSPRDPEYSESDPDDPNWVARTVRADGMRYVLRRRPDGDCTFLGAQGCTLPGEVRPLVCRLYPFEYTERGLLGVGDHYCPTAAVAPPGINMAQVLGMTEAEAERDRRQLYEEIAL